MEPVKDGEERVASLTVTKEMSRDDVMMKILEIFHKFD